VVINNFEGGTLTHNVFVFTLCTDLSTHRAIDSVFTDGWIASGSLVLGYRNAFSMSRGWEGPILMPGYWTGSDTYQMLLVYTGGGLDDLANPRYRLVTLAFANGSATVNIASFAPVVTTFYVTFNSNGGSAVPTQRVNIGTPAASPTPPPTREDRIFLGWYSDAGLTTPYVFSTPMTRDITLYAKWDYSTFTVTFNSNGGGAVTSQVVDNGGVAVRPSNPAWYANFSFVDWYKDAALTTRYYFGTPVTGNITLHARWAFMVTNGGDAGPGSLRHAVGNAPSGSTITVAPDVGTIALDRHVVIDRNLTIEGNGVTLTPRENWAGYSHRDPLLHVRNAQVDVTVSIRRIHFTGLRSRFEGAIDVDGSVIARTPTVIVESCIFSNINISAGSGIISNRGGILIVRGSTFFANKVYVSTIISTSSSNLNPGTTILTGNLFYDNSIVLEQLLSQIAANSTSAGFNVVDRPLGTEDGESGWVAVPGDKTLSEFLISGSPLDRETLEPVDGLRSIMPASPIPDFPTVDFFGNDRTWPGAPGAIR